MSKTKLKEIVNQLTEEQKKMLYETVILQRTEQLELGKIKIPQQSDIAIIGLSGRYPQAD